MFNETSVKDMKEVKDMCTSLGATFCMVAACHVLSESTVQGIDPTGSSGTRVEAKVCAVTLSILSSHLTITIGPDILRQHCHDSS